MEGGRRAGDQRRRPRCRLAASNRGASDEPGKPAQVLGDDREREFVLRTARSAQPKPTEPEDVLEVSKQHLDPLAVAARLLEGLGVHERASDVAGVLADIA
jgi:hypothetical protein